MKRTRRRKCCHCKELFVPDARNRRHQRYCSEAPCRRASKAARQQRWLTKPENQNYFQGPENVLRLQAWRARTPGYWKRKAADKSVALQDVSPLEKVNQPSEKTEETSVLPLQDVLPPLLGGYPPVIIGLISQIAGTTLQDDIASMSQNLVRLGLDIISQQGGGNGKERTHSTRPETTHSEAVQLG